MRKLVHNGAVKAESRWRKEGLSLYQRTALSADGLIHLDLSGLYYYNSAPYLTSVTRRRFNILSKHILEFYCIVLYSTVYSFSPCNYLKDFTVSK